jgi:hypothetical protein
MKKKRAVVESSIINPADSIREKSEIRRYGGSERHMSLYQLDALAPSPGFTGGYGASASIKKSEKAGSSPFRSF